MNMFVEYCLYSGFSFKSLWSLMESAFITLASFLVFSCLGVAWPSILVSVPASPEMAAVETLQLRVAAVETL